MNHRRIKKNRPRSMRSMLCSKTGVRPPNRPSTLILSFFIIEKVLPFHAFIVAKLVMGCSKDRYKSEFINLLKNQEDGGLIEIVDSQIKKKPHYRFCDS